MFEGVREEGGGYVVEPRNEGPVFYSEYSCWYVVSKWPGIDIMLHFPETPTAWNTCLSLWVAEYLRDIITSVYRCRRNKASQKWKVNYGEIEVVPLRQQRPVVSLISCSQRHQWH